MSDWSEIPACNPHHFATPAEAPPEVAIPVGEDTIDLTWARVLDGVVEVECGDGTKVHYRMDPALVTISVVCCTEGCCTRSIQVHVAQRVSA